MSPARVDANQQEIVKILRAVGATVQHLHKVGQGCPDLAVGYQGATYFLEIKDGSKPPSAQRLTAAQEKWHAQWRGHAAVVNSPLQALETIGVNLKGTIS